MISMSRLQASRVFWFLSFSSLISRAVCHDNAQSHLYPNCSTESSAVDAQSNVQIKVSDFLEVGGVADDCDDSICEAASRFRAISVYDCSLICSKVQKCEWWSAHQLFESAHINKTICSLYNNGGLPTVSSVMVVNATSGHKTCSPSLWSTCVEHHSFVEGRGYSELWVNATSRFGLPKYDKSCHEGNCDITDRFEVSSVSHCTAICSRVPECNYWSVMVNSEAFTCWLRRDKLSTSNITGAVSGDKTCAHHAPYFKLP